MNKKRLLILAKLLEMSVAPDAKPKIGFNMATFHSTHSQDQTGHACKTTACIGGWTLAAFDPTTWEQRTLTTKRGFFTRYDILEHASVKAQKILGLTDEQAQQLFFEYTYRWISPTEAAKVLRYAAKTGKIDWPQVIGHYLW